MVTVSNISVSEFNIVNEIKNKKNEDMAKCLEFMGKCKLPMQDLIDISPVKSKLTISFELKETNASIANGIRRCLSNEMEVFSFDFDANDGSILDTSDTFILSDFIKQQIELLPINQEYDYSNKKISLIKENHTEGIIDVLSSDIVVKDMPPEELYKIVGSTIVLCKLRPGEYIKINDIQVVKGKTQHNAGKFSLLSNITYKILDVDPIVETRTGQNGISSLKSNPTHFYMSYTTHRNVDAPVKIMVKCCDTLIVRLDKILEDMKNIANSDIYYFSPLLTLETTDDLKKLQIKGEYWTIINMISKYCYILTKGEIKFVSPGLIHPEKEIGVISIIHPEFSTLIQNSIKKIIEELKSIKKSFSNF